jgi:DNA-binding CsgD family transcriptional regulator
VLIGRTDELAAVERLLADARIGTAGILLVRGEAGIGKTSLLDHARTRSGSMTLLAARGVESESSVPFAGLLQLLRPLAAAVADLPTGQRRPLRVAFGLSAGAAPDRFAVGASTLALLAAEAAERPILTLVDDAHWLDRPSAEALHFAIRRLAADAVAVLVAIRDGEPSVFDGSDLPELRLAGLDPAGARTLLAERLGRRVTDGSARRALAVTGGNPLALLEMGAEAIDLADDAPLPPRSIPERLLAAFARRMRPLPAEARRALLVAAASDTAATAEIVRACERMGLDPSMLGAAEATGLVALGIERVSFRHPLARAACYGAASAAERRAAHRALAQSLSGADALDRRAWHLGLAAAGPEEEAAAALDDAGRRAFDRGAYASASRAAERSSRLSASPPRRADRLAFAADAALHAGDLERAASLVGEARPDTEGATPAARLDVLAGSTAILRGDLAAGIDLLEGAIDILAADDADAAVGVALACAIACYRGGQARRMLAAAGQAAACARSGAPVRRRVQAAIALGCARLFAGDDAAEGAAILRQAIDEIVSGDAAGADPDLLVAAAWAALFLREEDTGREFTTRAIDAARDDGGVTVLLPALELAARAAVASDEWPVGAALYGEALAIARDVGSLATEVTSLAALAWLHARQGHEALYRARAREATDSMERVGARVFGVWLLMARADLELGAGRLVDAVESLEGRRAALDEMGIGDADLAPEPELVEALTRLERTGEASAALARYAEIATAKGQPWALARLHRCRGVVAADGCFDEPFAAAIAEHARTSDTYEEARTRLLYGERLRRARRRAAARDELRRAYTAFDRLGAAPLRDRAAQELAATGEAPAPREDARLDELTPQELAVATMAARGLTNRDVAATLFLSPKTVEYHLRHVYQKLDLRSRADLLQAMSAEGVPGADR